MKRLSLQKKKIYWFILHLLFIVQGQSQQSIVLSTNFDGNHELSYQNESIDYDTETGFSVSLENLFVEVEYLKLGMGIEYMFKRKLTKTNNEFPQWTLGDELLDGTIPINFTHLSPRAKIQFRNIIYGVIKIPLNPTNIWKVKVGYSRPMGDGEYEGGYYGNLLYKGDMFYGFGVEVYINQSTFLELMFVN